MSWTSGTDVDGYEVQYSLKKTKDVPGAASANVTLKLRRGKRHYIRTYKKDANSVKVAWSDWSKPKRSKTVK